MIGKILDPRKHFSLFGDSRKGEDWALAMFELYNRQSANVWGTRPRMMKSHTVDGLRMDIEAVEEYGNVLWSGVRAPRVGDRSGVTLRGDCTIDRQSSTSPVAPEWTIDEDSK